MCCCVTYLNGLDQETTVFVNVSLLLMPSYILHSSVSSCLPNKHVVLSNYYYYATIMCVVVQQAEGRVTTRFCVS